MAEATVAPKWGLEDSAFWGRLIDFVSVSLEFRRIDAFPFNLILKKNYLHILYSQCDLQR